MRPVCTIKTINEILCLAATLLVLLPSVSCSSNKDYTTHTYRPYHERRNRGGGVIVEDTQSSSTDNGKQGSKKERRSTTVDEAWANLNVKLGKHDNKRLYKELKQWLGTPYQYGGHTCGEGSDCSGMVMEVYKTVYGIALERNTARMLEQNCKRIKDDDLREGDLVFFSTGGGNVSHVGIYLKENKFVHASSSRGVVVDDLTQPYYSTHYHTAARVTTR